MTAETDAPLIGLDFGGTKIEAVAMRGSDYAFRKRVATPETYHDAIRAIADLVREAEAVVGTVGRFGIGLPGPFPHERA